MTSTQTLSKTISSRMRLPIVSALKPKNLWPDSQGSIGCLLCPLGRNKCWEAVGPAGELSKGNLFKEIKRLLESRHEYLNEGESVPRAILFEVYMIGRNESFARPTILFCCERKPPRQRAMKLVRESLILMEYPGVQLGDCSRPPGLTHQPMPLFDPISEEDDPLFVRRFYSAILYRPPIKSLFGVPVYVQLSHGHLRAATIGGFICLGNKIVGLSVRHVLDKDQDESNPEDFGTDLEFSLEHEDFEEDVDGERDVSFVMMTSTGSISPSRFDSDESGRSINTEVPENTDIEKDLRSESGASNLSIPSQLNEGQETIGYSLILSVSNESKSADWAIFGLLPPFRFDSESLKCTDRQLGSIRVTNIVETPHSKAAVLIITGSNGAMGGTMSGNLSFVQLARSIAFQEMWTVRLEGPLLPGDCGSWVIDADSGALYGHIVAGDPGTSVAYVTPAKEIFSEIENKTGSKITFPSSESVMKYFASRTDSIATNFEEEMVGYAPIATSSRFPAHGNSTGGIEIRPETNNNEEIKIVKSESPIKYKFEDLLESLMPAGVKVEDSDTDIDVLNIVQLPPRNKRFVNRENELSEIHQVLSIQAVCCLTGAADVGKTEIALEYAHRHRDAYSNIFWVTNPSVMLQETFGKMCEDEKFAKVDEPPEQRRRKKWLAVLDNVEGGLEIKFLLYKWNLKQGSILITTRQREFAVPSGILWYRKEIDSLLTTPFHQSTSHDFLLATESGSDSIRGTNPDRNDQRSPKRQKTGQAMALTHVYPQLPSSEAVQDSMNSSTFNPISLMSILLDSYVQEHPPTPVVAQSQIENTEKAHSKATEKSIHGRKRTKTGCLTCRKRRIKCGEERPVCNNCVKSKRQCEGYNQRVIFKDPLNVYRPGALDSHLHLHSGQNEPTSVPQTAEPPTSKLDSIDLPSPQPKPANEIYDDDLWDVSDDDTVFNADFELSSNSYGQPEENNVGIIVALQARQEEPRSFTSFLNQSGILETYMPSPSSNPLKDGITARIFCHFVNTVAPTLSMYERQPANPSLVFQAHPIPKSHQHIWTYTIPTLALMNPGLLHSILALGSLHIGLMLNGTLTASLKHYAIALRRVAKAVSLQHHRQAPATLAACLLLGWYEVMCADHQKWSNHLQGTTMLLQEVDFAKIERYKKRVGDFRSSALHWSASSQANVQVDVLGELDESLICILLGEKPDGSDPSTSAINDNVEYTQRDLELHETRRDMFWWFCKQDMVQSILGGTRLTLPFKSWAFCPPRAPIGRITAVYGTNDHLILLLGRIADFTSRDLERKEISIRKYGGSRPPLNLGGPATISSSATNTSQHLEETQSTVKSDTTQPEREWQEIRNAFSALEDGFGEDFAALGPEFTDPILTPFGQAKVYRTYGIIGIWLNFYMGLIIAYRAHPSMPPAALMAAGIAAPQTSNFANEIGRIAYGICPSISQIAEVNPHIAAALIESSVPLFVAGVQYQNSAQRRWLIQQFSDIARLTGFQTAIAFARGCETSWFKNAQMGRGPPYHRPKSPSLNRERVLDNIPANDANKIVVSRAERVHYALGILSVDEDFEKLDLGQHD